MGRNILFVVAASLAFLGAPRESAAQGMGGGMGQGGMGQQRMTQASAPLAEGVVRKVDKDAGKLTIKHGPLPNLDMPAMTMVFRAKDPAMLDQVKKGDKVRFEAQDIGGQLTVVRIKAAQ
jgi:Cu(I)/Ag(I) efflux system periplasmic protein CusF